MATTSESIDRLQDYHVFLSFRGSDTRTNFTAHLYEALKRASIRTFIDGEGLKRGEALNPQLEEAIKRSDISIVIFSPGYASSRWCLDELVLILDRVREFGHKIVPIFYKVDPSHVRHQTECFETAFKSHQERGEKLEKIKAWKKALSEVADLSGWHHITNYEYEPKFIEKIVNDVNNKQLQGRKLVNVANTHLVGIDKQVKDVEAWLRDPTHDSMVFVLLGMGGIGKTTIADYVYRSYIKDFAGGCFVGKLRELFAASDGLHKARSRFLSGLNHGQSQKWKYPDDIQKINQYLSIRSVLIVFDEVTNEEQKEELLRGLVFCKGSKIIITTRYDLQLDDAKVHRVKFLNDNDALELFRRRVFKKGNPVEASIDQCKQMIHRFQKLPLALTVLGASLRGKNLDQWNETSQKLDKVADPQIQLVLQISYESLPDEMVKHLFLLIAFFFIGVEENLVIQILHKFFPKGGIQDLINSCLITINDRYHTIEMHQSLQDMAREIVRQQSLSEPEKRSILWDEEDSFDVLKNNKGTKSVQGLILDMEEIKEKGELKFEALTSMLNLIIVKLKDVNFIEPFSKFPEKLKWICWESCRLKSIPNGFLPKDLVSLQMQRSCLKRICDGDKLLNLESLKYIDLNGSEQLVRTPDFRGLPKLESLVLTGCVGLAIICESIVRLKGLVLLDISRCENLECIPLLPASIVRLEMSFCDLSDDSFPRDTVSNDPLPSLKRLDISYNYRITRLPDCFTNLPSLEYLFADHCAMLRSIICSSSSPFHLSARGNESLEIVKAPTKKGSNFGDYRRLGEVEGCFKLTSTREVDEKVLKSLGLIGSSMQLPKEVKVLFEFGIYSTYFVKEDLRPSYVTQRERGEPVQVRVSHDDNNGNIILGLNVSFVWRYSRNMNPGVIQVRVKNQTKDVNWKYLVNLPKLKNLEKCEEDCMWVSMWKNCRGDLLTGGDHLEALVTCHVEDVVREWGIRIVYQNNINDQEWEYQLLDEWDQYFNHHSSSSSSTTTSTTLPPPPTRICWTDRMWFEISDYHTSGSTYLFNGNRRYAPYLPANDELWFSWWGELETRSDYIRCPDSFLPKPAKLFGTNLGQMITGQRFNKSVIVRITRFWETYSTNNLNEVTSHNLVIVNEKGSMMHCSISSKFLAGFNGLLCEGKFYSIQNFMVGRAKTEYRVLGQELCISFDSSTLIKELTPPFPDIPLHKFQLVPFKKLVNAAQGIKNLVDILGVVVRFSAIEERQINGTTTKSQIVDLQGTEGLKISLALRGKLAGAIQKDEQIVIVTSTLIERKYGEVLASTSDASKIYINQLDVPEVLIFRKRLDDEASDEALEKARWWEEEFAKKKKSLFDVKQMEDTDASFNVEASISEIIYPKDWNYTKCRFCFQNLRVVCSQVVCGCSSPSGWRASRYPFNVWLVDETEDGYFELFDDDVAKMLQMDVKDLAQLCVEDNSGDSNKQLPFVLRTLVGTKHKFEAKLNSTVGRGYKRYRISKVFDE